MDRLIGWINRQALGTKLKWTYLVASGGVMLASTLFLIGIQLYFFSAALVRQTLAEATMASENLSAAMPRTADDVEAWIREVQSR